MHAPRSARGARAVAICIAIDRGSSSFIRYGMYNRIHYYLYMCPLVHARIPFARGSAGHIYTTYHEYHTRRPT